MTLLAKWLVLTIALLGFSLSGQQRHTVKVEISASWPNGTPMKDFEVKLTPKGGRPALRAVPANRNLVLPVGEYLVEVALGDCQSSKFVLIYEDGVLPVSARCRIEGEIGIDTRIGRVTGIMPEHLELRFLGKHLEHLTVVRVGRDGRFRMTLPALGTFVVAAYRKGTLIGSIEYESGRKNPETEVIFDFTKNQNPHRTPRR